MKTLKYFILLVLVVFSGSILKAQEIQIIAPQKFLYQPAGAQEMVIEFEVVNISASEQTVFEVRTINDLPANWTSSLCFGALCFPSEFDSIATTPDFFTPPVQPNDTLPTSIHVFTDASIGTAHVQIQVGTFHNPTVRETLDFYFTTDPSVGVEEEGTPADYFLAQNYPNPFNPSTSIKYGVKEAGFVILKVYNILGAEVANLVNEYKSAGSYEADFSASKLSSGVYIYRLSANNFVQTRKMILEK